MSGNATEGANTTGATTEVADTAGSTEGSTSPSTSSSTTEPDGSSAGSDTESDTGDGFCGDGHVDPGEECDNGADNADDADCTASCTAAYCGDGVTHATEQCDDGNDIDEDGCLHNCALASCGDEILWEEQEQCDPPGEVNDDDGTICNSECAWTNPEKRLVFLSSMAFPGDFSVPPELVGQFPHENKAGVSLADLRCQQLAAKVGIPAAANFVAWVSDNMGSNLSDAAARLAPVETDAYVLKKNNITVAPDWAALTTMDLANAIDQDEDGNAMDAQLVWSNTSTHGETLSKQLEGAKACNNWYSSGAEELGQVGAVTAQSPTWTHAGASGTCGDSKRIYCFEGPGEVEP